MSHDEQTPTPGEYILAELKARGWTQVDLAQVTGRPMAAINEVVKSKRGITAEMAVALGQAFGNDPQIWMEREAAYRLSLTTGDDTVRRRARIYELAPINEIRKRGWIPASNDINDIEPALRALLQIKSIDEVPQISAVMRKSEAHLIDLSPSQITWCCRVRQLASCLEAAPFSLENMDKCERALRKLAAYPTEARKVSAVLADHGIRFVVVEHLGGTKVDGATLWLSEDCPVIGMSMRYDRIDNFWFTLFHEFSHVRHRDAVSVDSNITGSDDVLVDVKPEFERRADDEASASLVDPKELKSFILRVGPLYSEAKIVQFSHRVKIHPGIVVGQLHARNEFRSGYRACRDLLVKVRDFVTAEALTDGWGHSVDLRTSDESQEKTNRFAIRSTHPTDVRSVRR